MGFFKKSKIGFVKNPSIVKNNRLYCLLGDSVSNIHFFTTSGLNTGVFMSGLLSELINRQPNFLKISHQYNKQYNQITKKIINLSTKIV